MFDEHKHQIHNQSIDIISMTRLIVRSNQISLQSGHDYYCYWLQIIDSSYVLIQLHQTFADKQYHY